MRQTTPHVVVSDVHSRHAHLERCHEVYQQHDGQDITIVSAGDLIGGNGFGSAREAIDIALDNNTQLVMGNQSGSFIAPYFDEDEERRAHMAREWLKNYERGILAEYGLAIEDLRDDPIEAVEQLVAAMRDHGHGDFVDAQQLYYLTGSFLVVHAGLVAGIRYGNQLNQLDKIKEKKEFWKTPPQVFGVPGHKLSSSRKVPKGVKLRGRTLVTGHHHLPATAKRVTDNRRRVRLAGPKAKPHDPVYVWQSWDGEVVEIHAKRGAYS